MARRLFTLNSALSLLLCAATVVVWVRSHETSYSWSRTVYLARPERSKTSWGYAEGRAVNAWSGEGSILIGEGEVMNWGLREEPLPSSPTYEWHASKPPSDPVPLVGSNPPGFLWHGFYAFRSAHSSTLVLPCWVVVLLTALSPFTWCATRLAGLGTRRRRRLGQCTQCGYDLRATPGRCPECGTPASMKQA